MRYINTYLLITSMSVYLSSYVTDATVHFLCKKVCGPLFYCISLDETNGLIGLLSQSCDMVTVTSVEV